MSSPVLYQQRGRVALISLNNPPVNGLSQAVRQALLEAYQEAFLAEGIQAILISSTFNFFSGGADIKEFAGGNFNQSPSLPDVLNTLENSSKIIIAAIEGMALGGGLELALSCDYRFVSTHAKLGLPEVKLGLIPGAGGTQRLPRLTGPAVALDMIVSGKSISASDAKNFGLVDRLHEDKYDFLDSAFTYANQLVDEQAPTHSCKTLQVPNAAQSDELFARYREKIARTSRGLIAPEKCVEAVEAACRLPLDAGLKREQALFMECLKSPQSKAQQYLFFAERKAAKVFLGEKSPKPNTIEQVAIIGAGTMGAGIAMNFMNAGINTLMLDLDQAAIDRGLSAIKTNYAISQKKGRFTEQQVTSYLSNLNTCTDYSALANADLVIEAVFEKMELKKTVFNTLDKTCKPETIFASNTSTLDINEIAKATQRPDKVIGMHFFSPANVMRLLEVVKGKHSASNVIASALQVAQRIQKIPVVVGVCFGFVGNRMLEPYGREAMRLILEGASPSQVDSVLTSFGFAMGLCEMSDLAGIDVGYLTRQHRRAEIQHDESYAVVADTLYERGHYGQKSGKGFYTYNGREKSDNDEVLDIAREKAEALGITQRKISEEEILERCLYPLINEAAEILAEGVAARASDCDLVYAHGYGFPISRGGPLYYADSIGLKAIRDKILHYQKALGDYGEMWFQPAALLQELADKGKSFSDV